MEWYQPLIFGVYLGVALVAFCGLKVSEWRFWVMAIPLNFLAFWRF